MVSQDPEDKIQMPYEGIWADLPMLLASSHIPPSSLCLECPSLVC